METQGKKPGLLLGLMVGMAAALSAFVSLLAPLAPAFMAYLGLAGGLGPLLLSIAASGVGLYLFAGATGLYLFAIIAVAALLLYIMMKRQASWFDTILATSFAIFAGLYAMFCLPDILAGRGAFDTVEEIFSSSWQAYAAQMAEAGSLFGQDMAGQYEDFGKYMLAELPAVFPFTLCVLGCCFGFVDVLIARALSRKRGALLRPMVRFSLWRLPKGYLLAALLLWGGSALCGGIGIANADAISLCCMAVGGMPLAMQGVCTLTFLFQMRQGRVGLILPFLLLMVLTFPFCLLALALLGAAEQLLKLRARILDSLQGPQ